MTLSQVKEMSADGKPPGSAGDPVVTFEELPELSGQPGSSTAAPSQAAAGYPKPGYPSPDYGCPPGQKWDKDAKKCVPVKKGEEGSESGTAEFAREKEYRCKAGEVWDEKEGKCVPVKAGQEGTDFAGRDKDYKCGAGEVWDDKKGKCVPIKEALAERDAKIKELSDILSGVQSALRLKEIETTVDEQIRGGHIAPSQRDKVVNFMAGIPDDKHSDILGIFAHQKFPLATETSGGTPPQKPGEVKNKIGETESIEGLSEEDKAELAKRFEIPQLVAARGVKK